MRKPFLPFFVLLLAALAAPAVVHGYPEMVPLKQSSLVGRSAPDIQVPLLGGGEFQLSEARGEVVVLAFWASWCGPCRKELPALRELSSKLSRDRQLKKKVRIILVNVDRDPRDARRFLNEVGLSGQDMPVALDSNAVALGRYSVTSMPTTFVVDTRGTVKLHKLGYSVDKGLADLEAAIRAAR